MTSGFHRILGRAEYVHDRVFADDKGWTFYPMRTPPNRVPVTDTTRPIVTDLSCIYESLPVTVMVGDEERVSQTPLISVQKVYLPGRVVRGDRFVRTEDGKAFEVVKPGPDHLTRWRFVVVEVDV